METINTTLLQGQPWNIKHSILAYSHPRIDVNFPEVQAHLNKLQNTRSETKNHNIIRKMHSIMRELRSTKLMSNVSNVYVMRLYIYLFRIMNLYPDFWEARDKRGIPYYISKLEEYKQIISFLRINIIITIKSDLRDDKEQQEIMESLNVELERELAILENTMKYL